MKKLLAFWLLCILHISAMTGAYAEDAHYDRLLNKAAFIHLDKPRVLLMQLQLAEIYQHNPNWNRDAKQIEHPLKDGLTGPVTLFWLQRFVTDFKIPPIGDFTTEILARLEYMADFSSSSPQKMAVLLSVDFSNWNNMQPALQRDSSYTIRRSGTDEELLELVDRYLQVPEPDLTTFSYQLTTEDFKELQSEAQVLLLLAKLENKHYDNFPELKAAIENELKDYPLHLQKILPVIRQFLTNAGITIDAVILDRVTRKLENDPLFTSLNRIFSELLEKELGNITYPDKIFFDKAAKDKLRLGIGACVINKSHNPYISAIRISDSNFKQLTEELLWARNDDLLNLRQDLIRIETLRSGVDKCHSEEREFVDELVDDIYTYIIQPSIASVYKKKPAFNKALPIQWTGAGCGCVLDELAGTVYGFYPFWMANGDIQTVNFSVLSRVAYYGLSFDTQGIIRQTNDNNHTRIVTGDGGIASSIQDEFIRVARKHNTKVDWVIHNDKTYWNNWQEQSLQAREDSFENLADNIVSLLTHPLAGTYDKIKDTLTLGMISQPTWGDGVTLYFNNYPDDLESINLFNSFFSKLKQRLNATDGNYFVNIMVQQSALGEGIYKYGNILQRISDYSIQQHDSSNNLQSKVLVLIEEPTTNYKKKLRLEVENGELHGLQRNLLLHNIIPVIGFGGKNWMQLEDDLVYFKENFGGVGFWPLVTNESHENADAALKCTDIATVTGCLVRYFQNIEHDGQPNSWLNNFVCENRDIIRLLLFTFIVISLGMIWSYLGSCQLRKRISKNYILYLFVTAAPILLLTLLLLMYDPLLKILSKGNLSLIIVIMAVVVVGIVINQRRKLRARKPVRPRTL